MKMPLEMCCDICVPVVIMEDEKNATCETFWVKIETRITLKHVNNSEGKKKICISGSVVIEFSLI